ncbi:hypothetical protein ACFQX7_26600 [Luedemannella flava]
MRGKGPLITLIAGAVVAVVLLALSANAAGRRDAANSAATGGDGIGVAATTAATASPTAAAGSGVARPSGSGVASISLAFAGDVLGGDASIALAVKDDHVVAYLCDGEKTEAWLQGTYTPAGTLSLSGRGGTLTATQSGGKVTGTVTAGGRTWPFTVGKVAKPSGLYRAVADVRDARVVAGWIVLPGGRQVGIATVAGVPGTAPTLDVTSGTATLDGTQLSAAPVEGGPL